MNFQPSEGTTPIDLNEAEGLIPSLTTQEELNEFEALNIAEAIDWAHRSTRLRRGILELSRLKLLHEKMFEKTWTWAGAFGTTQKSIGSEAWRIQTDLVNLIEDCKIWIETGAYPPAEISARFHHRLVLIHPFANGNGRWARLATDLLCSERKWPVSEWGFADLVGPGGPRLAYIAALRAADGLDHAPLIDFMT